MTYQTGQTITEVFLSIDEYNNPVVPATFDYNLLKDGVLYTGTSVNFSLTNASTGLYKYDLTPLEVGDYQVYINNNNVSLIYISNIFKVQEISGVTLYVGL